MRSDWSNPWVWMLAGFTVVVVGAVVAAVGDSGEAFNPVIAVGVLLFLVGAFTAAVQRGLRKSRENDQR